MTTANISRCWFLGSLSSNHAGGGQVLHPDIVGLAKDVGDLILVPVGQLGTHNVTCEEKIRVRGIVNSLTTGLKEVYMRSSKL